MPVRIGTMTQWVSAIQHGWVIDGEVPGPDVDEFAEPADVIAALARWRGDSLLAVQHPHRTPRALAAGLSPAAALPEARRELDRLLAAAYRPVTDIVAPYRVDGPDGTAVGVLCLVDPREMSGVRHSEEVYPRVVAERAEMLSGLGCATSAAMLVPVANGEKLTDAVLSVTRTPEAVRTTDPAGRIHRLWLSGPGPGQDALLSAARSGPLLVADGNHRVAAAARAGTSLLALITAGPDLRVGAFHRELAGTGLGPAELAAAWRRNGSRVREGTGAAAPGVVAVHAGSTHLLVELPPPEPGEPLPRIDHGVAERVLIAGALGIDPEGSRVRALPTGHRPAPDADAVLEFAPVSLADVLAVHAQRRLMPRKSTYFTPKPRTGLLLADLDS
jgi:hypothetical protein